MPGRVDLSRLRTEKGILRAAAAKGEPFRSEVRRLSSPGAGQPVQHPKDSLEIGFYRSDERKLATANLDILEAFKEAGHEYPSFLAAGAREHLWFDPSTVKAAVVTTGGLAPGLNSVVHAIINQHFATYGLNPNHGSTYGVFDGLKGLLDLQQNHRELTPEDTRPWLRDGGSHLGSVRHFGNELQEVATQVAENLSNMSINILYVIGGDGSQLLAHTLAQVKRIHPSVAIVSVPKTMDNDVLWVTESFGHDSAVAQAVNTINTLQVEAQSTRRIGLLKFFGAESGFVVANATLASGHVDLVLVPEVFLDIDSAKHADYWDRLLGHVKDRVKGRKERPYAIIVVAEGVEEALASRKLTIDEKQVDPDKPGSSMLELLRASLAARVSNFRGEQLDVFENEPRHYIRSGPADSRDQVLCERLGALAVDTALAGFTDCMVSHWLSEFVIVPLRLVTQGQKRITTQGVFWKQVESSTGQPHAPVPLLPQFAP